MTVRLSFVIGGVIFGGLLAAPGGLGAAMISAAWGGVIALAVSEGEL